MKVNIIFPKATSYYSQSVDTQRTYNEIVMKYLNMLIENKCTIEYLLEDRWAYNLIKDSHYAKAKMITCICKSDITFFNSCDIKSPILPEVVEEYSYAEECSYDYSKQYLVPISLLHEDRQAYLDKKVESYRTRLRKATDRMLSERKNIIMFTTDSNSNMATPISSTFHDGDGRLLITVNLTNGNVLTYYGGVYLQEDYIPELLKLER